MDTYYVRIDDTEVQEIKDAAAKLSELCCPDLARHLNTIASRCLASPREHQTSQVLFSSLF